MPATFAANGYDTIMLIDAALSLTNGDASDTTAVRNALMTAQFGSVRGKFRFNTNHYPIHDIYVSKVVKRSDGKFQTVFSENSDQYVSECKM